MISFTPKFCEQEKNETLAILQPILPENYTFIVIDFKLVKCSTIVGETLFNVNFRVNIENKESIEEFLCELGKKSGITYNRYYGDKPGKGTKVVIRGYRKRQHFVKRYGLKDSLKHSDVERQPGSECIPGKNTSCPAKITFSLSGERLHNSNRFKLSLTKQHKQKYPLEINLEFIHNHNINTADALRYRPISDECKKKFLELFAEDHTPSSALAQHQKDLRCEISDDDFMSVMADRSIVPDYFWAFHFHKKYVENTSGSVNGPDAFKQAKERIAKYNEKHQIKVAKMEDTAKEEIIVAICDPFCRRVHENLPQAGDIVLVDVTSTLSMHFRKKARNWNWNWNFPVRRIFNLIDDKYANTKIPPLLRRTWTRKVLRKEGYAEER